PAWPRSGPPSAGARRRSAAPSMQASSAERSAASRCSFTEARFTEPMAHATTTADVTTRSSATPDAAPRPERSPVSLAGRFVMWLAIMAAGVMALAPLTALVSREMDAWSLVNANEATIRAELAREWPRSMSAARLETLAELALQIDPPDTKAALE